MRTALTKVPYGSLNSAASTCDALGTMSRRPRASQRTVWEALLYTFSVALILIRLKPGAAKGRRHRRDGTIRRRRLNVPSEPRSVWFDLA
ncbi:hypothetical protein EVAR_90208_1 [Eumeta japonica]|uniref:Uncharacterized protein n=1 Tax=Eumeta variegata TaxID=151549 RepID=A0A4C1WUH3_EUMVA|nr:hypothetical protein EVAR_90208_1 [Eumeta japonica]